MTSLAVIIYHFDALIVYATIIMTSLAVIIHHYDALIVYTTTHVLIMTLPYLITIDACLKYVNMFIYRSS